jgi:hypothetical protein
MSDQLVWACRGKIYYSVQQQDGSYQLVLSANQEPASQSMDTTSKQKTTVKDTNQFLSSSKTEISPWLW